MGLLGRDQILQADDLPHRDVEVPEWGGSVRVRALTARERDEYEVGSIKGKGASRQVNLQNMRARLVAATVVDEAGARLFTEKDVRALGEKSGAVIDRLFDAARHLSGMTSEDVDQLAGKSETTPTADSDSD